MYIFDGKKLALEKEEELKDRVQHLQKRDITPKLYAVLIGDNPASKLYVSLKKKAAERIGVILQLNELQTATDEQIIHLIRVANKDQSIHGIMIQLPLPQELHGTEDLILNTIAPEKDVDGLTTKGKYFPATVKAIFYAIEEAQKRGFLSKDLSTIDTCVEGAKGEVGKRVTRELEVKGARVTGVDIKDLASQGSTLRACSVKADLLISATGVPGLIKKSMVKKGAVVIDVGAPSGDVSEDVREVASFITPVPGGIGPMTVVCLLENLVDSAQELNNERTG